MNKYKYFLHRIPEIGDVTVYKLLEAYGNEENIYYALKASDERLSKILGENKIANAIEFAKSYSPDMEYEKLLASGIKVVSMEDDIYPDRLRCLNPMPYLLYYKGELPKNDIPSVAVIGARNCSEYGTFTADAFGKGLAEADINVISGLARGVDGIAQRGAVKAGGRTYAVLGCGVDVCYPERNKDLYKEIQRNGGILSIFPPGSEPLKQQFPQRNRIVAALSDLVLVVEARLQSGTSITVDLALKMGKDIYAVPGRVTDRLSDGCNMLIRDGAGVALSPEDVIREINIMWNRSEWRIQREKACVLKEDGYEENPGMNAGEINGILAYLDIIPRSVEQIHALRLEKEPEAVLKDTLSRLIMECAEGRAEQIGSGYFYIKMNKNSLFQF